MTVTYGEDDARRAVAEQVRERRLQAARSAYENAALSGLCEEGRIEAALDAIRTLDLDRLLHKPH